MKVSELIRDLQRFPDDAQVIFSVDGYCPEGYPEWVRCNIRHRVDDEGDEPPDIVEVVLRELSPDCV